MTEQQKPQQKEQDKFKFEAIYLLPILASLLFGTVCAYVLAPIQAEVPLTPVDPSTPGAPIGDAIYFVVLIAISATVFYLLIKRGSKRIIKGLIVTALTTASLLLSYFYLASVFVYLPEWELLIIPLIIIITVLFDLAIFRFGGIARNVAVIGIGGALGVFFGKFIPLWSAVLILAFLAVYDIIAVYRGPVGKIAESGLDQLHGLSFSFKDIQMGLGDLVFYSMLAGAMFFKFVTVDNALWFLPYVVSIIGILAGSIITLFMLEKKGIFPGLPFPIMLGLAGGLISALVVGLPLTFS